MPGLKRIAISIAQVLAALSLCGLALYVADSGVDFKWVAIGCLTLLLFGSVCYKTKDFWGDPWYWATLSGVFLLHCVAAGLLQRNRPMLPGMDYAAIGILESLPLFGLLLYLFG